MVCNRYHILSILLFLFVLFLFLFLLLTEIIHSLLSRHLDLLKSCSQLAGKFACNLLASSPESSSSFAKDATTSASTITSPTDSLSKYLQDGGLISQGYEERFMPTYYRTSHNNTNTNLNSTSSTSTNSDMSIDEQQTASGVLTVAGNNNNNNPTTIAATPSSTTNTNANTSVSGNSDYSSFYQDLIFLKGEAALFHRVMTHYLLKVIHIPLSMDESLKHACF